MAQYKYISDDAQKFKKYGHDLTVYGENIPDANMVLVDVDEGLLQEFYDTESTYMYSIVEGEGTFVLDDEIVTVKPRDLLVIPPKTRIHYFGKLRMVLCVTPAFDEKNERHVGFVEESESPYSL